MQGQSTPRPPSKACRCQSHVCACCLGTSNKSHQIPFNTGKIIFLQPLKTKVMKRTLIAVCLLSIVLVPQLQAQSRHPHNEFKNELGVDAGPFSFMGSAVNITVGFFDALGSSLSHRATDMKLYGHYGLHYYYQVKPWCQVGFRATFEGAGYTHYTDSTRTAISDKYSMGFVTLMPSVRFTYLNRPWVRLYSGVDLGVSYLWDDRGSSQSEKSSQQNVSCAFNITPIGITVGKSVYGLLETNFGYASYVVVGIGCRF